MGAPKQKWTAEEEAALKAGIARYGVGKWSTIVKDPEFGAILRSRSNVDLKDKWRNINVMLNGFGSRQRGKPVFKSTPLPHKPDEDAMALDVTPAENFHEILNVKPVEISAEPLSNASSKKPISRLDDLIIEAITKLKEPRGSSRATIASYIEERYCVPPYFERTLATNLKLLTENEQLLKVKHQYRIAPSGTSLNARNDRVALSLEGAQKDSSDVERNGIKIISKAQIDAELEEIRSMTAEEAAAVAAQAIAQAEAAIAEAEAAAKEAEEAEAKAEASQCFADATEAALREANYRYIRVW